MTERNDEKETPVNRKRKLTIRLTEQEFERLDSGLKKTTFRKMSEYARAVLFNRKITVYERNKSLDDFIEEMILLRTELNRIGNNFNQVVRRINGAKDSGELKALAVISFSLQGNLLEKVDEIKSRINQFSDKWLQKL